jgi:hypothetical protein
MSARNRPCWSGLFFIMDAQAERDVLLDRANDAIATANRQRAELWRNIGSGRRECKRGKQWQTLQSGLAPAVAISLCVRAQMADRSTR